MTNRFDISKTPPIRAERRAPSAGPYDAQTVPATAGGLVRSTMIAAVSAGAVLVLAWLPAEYGVDPTGFGALTGLTEMGEIKQQLATEAEADAQLALAQSTLSPLAASTAPQEIVQRLDRIEAQLATLVAGIGPAPAAEQEPPSGLAAPVAAQPTPAAVAEASAQSTSEWRDEVSYTLNPGEGIEVKLAMQEGQTARFAWTANGGVVNFDLHGDGGGQKISYEQGRAVLELEGALTAAFTGNHGWFWRNRSDAPVTVTLRTAGDYAELRAP